MIQRDTIYTNVALRPDNTVWWEGARRPGARVGDRLARPPLDAPERRARGPPEQPLHGAGRRGVRRSRRRGRRPEGVPISAILFGARRARAHPARVPGLQLAARHVPGGDAGLGDHGGGHRCGRRRAPRSDGHAPLLRLQHGRLLGALARDGQAPARARRRSSASTGSGGTPRDGSSGRASARTCAFSSGSSSAAGTAARPRRRRSATAPRPGAIRDARPGHPVRGHGGAPPRRSRGLAGEPPEPGGVLPEVRRPPPRGIRAEWEALGSRLRVR